MASERLSMETSDWIEVEYKPQLLDFQSHTHIGSKESYCHRLG